MNRLSLLFLGSAILALAFATQTRADDKSAFPNADGGRNLITKHAYVSDVKRWDVAVFKYPEEPQTNYIKRLAGLPGETVVLPQGKRHPAAAVVFDTIKTQGAKIEITRDDRCAEMNDAHSPPSVVSHADGILIYSVLRRSFNLYSCNLP